MAISMSGVVWIARSSAASATCLLAETDETVETVAERLGLHSAAHLSRVFVSIAARAPAPTAARRR